MIRWVNDKFNKFSSHSTDGTIDKGTKCKKCEKKISDAYEEINDRQIQELIEHLPKCRGEKVGTVKLLGCHCQLKNKEFEVILKDKRYNEYEDLVACLSCQSLDQYKDYKKEFNLDGLEVGNEGSQMSLIIIYGAKKKDDKKNDSYCCEKCKISGYNEKKQQYTLRRITHYYIDFTEKVWYFGTNCSCAEEFKRENQQSCDQCGKTEWPDMKKGWLLDYEIKKAFCSPDCHVAHRNLQWEETEKLQKVEMFPPELEISNTNQNSDWEKEGNKRNVLYWWESVKEMKKQLEESKKKTPDQRHPNEIPHQQKQINWLLKLYQNTHQKVEQNYRNKYGKTELDILYSPNQKNSSTNIAPLIIGGTLILSVVIGLFIITNKPKRKYKKYGK